MPEIDLTNGAVPSGTSTGSFVDGALADLFADGGDLGDLGSEPAVAPPRARTRTEPADKDKPRGERARAQPDDDGGEAEDGELGEPPLEGDGETESDPEGDAEQERASQAEHVRGSQDDPYTVKDLPADKYIELKVDGETRTVSLAEMAKGYIREETFHQRVGKVQQQAQEALDGAKRATEMREKTRENLRAFVEDPDEMLEFFMGTEEREAVLENLARRYALIRKTHRENPEERLKFQRQRDVQRLQQERAAFERQQEETRKAEEQRVQMQRAEQIFKPGWEEGLRKAGFPTPTKELYEEVMVRVNQRHIAGHAITSADIAEFTHRAAKLLELAPRGKNRPAPAPAAAPREETRRGNGKRRDPWKDVPRQERIRDPEYFLQGLGRRELGY